MRFNLVSLFFCDKLFAVNSFSEKIKAKALEIGFHKIGIVRAEVLREEAENFKKWLDEEYHGEMKWLEREPEKRSNPQLIFPEAQSVIVTALNYYTPHQHDNSTDKGKISRYAWGDDYHDVVGEKLRNLLSWIESENQEAKGKICVDIQPIMDKAWAVRAGIGWLGKHSNVITKEFGSWFFIGEILLNLKLDYDSETVPNHCGNCRMCLDACPTKAIVLPYVVDSKRCISYANIELRSPEIPEDVAGKMNGWLYGCDICQDVCPWNRFEKPTTEPRFEPRQNNISPDLEEILSLDHEKYVEKFRRSAIKRAKLSGLRRNAETLLKNTLELEKK